MKNFESCRGVWQIGNSLWERGYPPLQFPDSQPAAKSSERKQTGKQEREKRYAVTSINCEPQLPMQLNRQFFVLYFLLTEVVHLSFQGTNTTIKGRQVLEEHSKIQIKTEYFDVYIEIFYWLRKEYVLSKANNTIIYPAVMITELLRQAAVCFS